MPHLDLVIGLGRSLSDIIVRRRSKHLLLIVLARTIRPGSGSCGLPADCTSLHVRLSLVLVRPA